MRDYERLSVEEFGHQLLTSNDLDPIYCALVDMKMDEAQLNRWLVAYWCFYHAGAASWLSEAQGLGFWNAMETAADNPDARPNPFGGRWPRGSERRHFRGKQARDAVAELRRAYDDQPERMVTYIAGEGGDFQALTNRVKEHRGFGPWIAFKCADMVDRVLGVPVDFTQAAVFMFKDPVQSALMLWRQRMGLPENARPKDEPWAIHQVVDYLKGEFTAHKAPPLYDRPVDLQEVETVLCKWKSHMNGHYPLWNDIDDINKGLEPWTKHSETARKFLEAMPKRA